MSTSCDHLVITVAHHVDNEFYELARVMPQSGGAMLDWNGAQIEDVTHEVHPAALFASLPDVSCMVDGRSTHDQLCVMLDARDVAGSIVDDKEISIDIANDLLDGAFERRLEAARGNLAAFYAADAAR